MLNCGAMLRRSPCFWPWCMGAAPNRGQWRWRGSRARGGHDSAAAGKLFVGWTAAAGFKLPWPRRPTALLNPDTCGHGGPPSSVTRTGEIPRPQLPAKRVAEMEHAGRNTQRTVQPRFGWWEWHQLWSKQHLLWAARDDVPAASGIASLKISTQPICVERRHHQPSSTWRSQREPAACLHPPEIPEPAIRPYLPPYWATLLWRPSDAPSSRQAQWLPRPDQTCSSLGDGRNAPPQHQRRFPLADAIRVGTVLRSLFPSWRTGDSPRRNVARKLAEPKPNTTRPLALPWMWKAFR